MAGQGLGHPHARDFVHMPTLINRALPDVSRSKARMMICHGNVKVGDETIGLPDLDLTRERLRGQEITVGKKTFTINEVGNAIRRQPGGDVQLRRSPA